MAQRAAHSGRPKGPWNIFATELEHILEAPERNMTINDLDDVTAPNTDGVVTELVHRETVRRLVVSLNTPENLPTLGEGELERLFATCKFTDEERLRLRGALLAVYVQRALNERLGPDDARAGAEQILPIITDALLHYRNTNVEVGIGALKGGSDQAATEELALATALDAIDRGTLALNLIHEVRSAAERLERAQAARTAFAAALEDLGEANDNIKQGEVWRYWHDTAVRGLQDAGRRVTAFGGD